MRLLELKPRWTGYASNGNRDEQIINGLTFLCPHCGLQTGQRLGVRFHPPIDEGGWVARGVVIAHDEVEWTRTGDTFETLSLAPSINATQNVIECADHWHGFIVNGEVTSA